MKTRDHLRTVTDAFANALTVAVGVPLLGISFAAWALSPLGPSNPRPRPSSPPCVRCAQLMRDVADMRESLAEAIRQRDEAEAERCRCDRGHCGGCG